MNKLYYQGDRFKMVINEYDEYELDDVLARHATLLSRLADERIFMLGATGHDYYIAEQCDANFYYHLTAAECEELSAMFKEMAEGGLYDREGTSLTDSHA